MDVLFDNTTIEAINQSSDEMCFRAAATVVTVSSPRSSSHSATKALTKMQWYTHFSFIGAPLLDILDRGLTLSH